MRLILALIYISFGIWLYLNYSSSPNFYVGLALAVLLLLSSTFLFNKGLLQRLKSQSSEEYLKEQLEKGRVNTESYHIQKAFCYDDLGTGCIAYFLKISNEQTLLLYGQYLYSYGPITDDEEFNQDRLFPTEKLTLYTLKSEKEPMDMRLEGLVIEPIEIPEPNFKLINKLIGKLIDGKVINQSFESLLSNLSDPITKD